MSPPNEKDSSSITDNNSEALPSWPISKQPIQVNIVIIHLAMHNHQYLFDCYKAKTIS